MPEQRSSAYGDASAESARIVIISPVRNESSTLERTVACVERQSLRPCQWILVDDGSTDETPGLLAALAARLPWVTVVQRADRGFRQLGGGVIEAFDAGRAAIAVEYDFVAKMDVDLEFGPDYLRTLVGYFAREPRLAAASGKVYRREGERLVEEFMIDEMVAGQFKFYRRECFERIGGFVREVMWDGIDFHRCRMEGYCTRSLPDEALKIIHLRLMGSSDKSIYRGRLRWGRGQWFMGSSPWYVLASGLRRSLEKPYGLGGMLIVAGYVEAMLKRAPRYDYPGFRSDLRRWQRRRLVGLLAGKGTR